MTTKLILTPTLQSAQRHLIGQIDDLKRDSNAHQIGLPEQLAGSPDLGESGSNKG